MEQERTLDSGVALPADDVRRTLTVARPETEEGLEHLGVVPDTCTQLLERA